MREIKFRMWDKEQKKMYAHEKLMFDGIFDNLNAIECNIELMQFTGLLDKNGKEIYEGDIIKFMDDSLNNGNPFENISEVFWWEPFVSFGIKNTHEDLNFMTVDDIEVIGNIYQNKELL
jgi:uncharacterized phage protein (TIGR01671 family)